jgi:beta-lactamase regulating signal transducer with metallopeptidase domain
MNSMIAMLVFSAVAALLVYLAGRGDQARDPRLTVIALGLLAIFPLLGLLPKLEILPAGEANVDSSDFPWATVLMVAWAAGFLVAATRLGFAAKGISNWRKRSTLVERMGRVEIRSLPGLKGPVAAGVIRPVVFLPESWSEWSKETRRIVLDHEMAHHRRRDPLWRWVAEIACVVSGCNPLVIWMKRRLTAQCEFACDVLVLKDGIPAGDYARVLCDFAEDRLPHGPVLAMAGTSSLEARVRRLVLPRKQKGSVGLCALVFLTLAGAGALATLSSRAEIKTPFTPAEVELRWSADPFPGE